MASQPGSPTGTPSDPPAVFEAIRKGTLELLREHVRCWIVGASGARFRIQQRLLKPAGSVHLNVFGCTFGVGVLGRWGTHSDPTISQTLCFTVFSVFQHDRFRIQQMAPHVQLESWVCTVSVPTTFGSNKPFRIQHAVSDPTKGPNRCGFGELDVYVLAVFGSNTDRFQQGSFPPNSDPIQQPVGAAEGTIFHFPKLGD